MDVSCSASSFSSFDWLEEWLCLAFLSSSSRTAVFCCSISEVSFLVSLGVQLVVFVEQRFELGDGFEQLEFELFGAFCVGLHAR